jgi:hypothetical protein
LELCVGADTGSVVSVKQAGVRDKGDVSKLETAQRFALALSQGTVDAGQAAFIKVLSGYPSDCDC